MTPQESVIAAILESSHKAIPVCLMRGVVPEWFKDPILRQTYQGALERFKVNKSSDPISLATEYHLDQMRLDDILSQSTSVAHIEYYLDALEAEYIRSNAASIGADIPIILQGYSDTDIKTGLGDIQGKLTALVGHAQDDRHIGDVAEDVLQQWDDFTGQGLDIHIGGPGVKRQTCRQYSQLYDLVKNGPYH